jgi:hypothetical protein
MKKIIATSFILMFLASCAIMQPILPENTKKVYVQPVDNLTLQYGIESKLTNTIIEEIMRSRYLSLVDEKDADVILKVTIERYILQPLTYDRYNVPDRYEMQIITSVSLIDNDNNTTLWTEPNMKEIQIYRDKDRNPSGEDWIDNEKSEEEVRGGICNNMGRMIVRRIVK